METKGVVQEQGRIPPPTGCHFLPIPRSPPKKIPLSRPEGFQTWPQTIPQEGGVTGRQGQPLASRRAGKSLTMQFAARMEERAPVTEGSRVSKAHSLQLSGSTGQLGGCPMSQRVI